MANIWDKFDFESTNSKIVEDTLNKIAKDLEIKTKDTLSAKFLCDYIIHDDDYEEKYKGFDFLYKFRVELSDSHYGHILLNVLESNTKDDLLIYSDLVGFNDINCKKNKEDIIRTFEENISTNKMIQRKILSLHYLCVINK